MPYIRKSFAGAAALSMAVLMGSTSAHAIQVTGGASGQSLADTLFLNVPGLTVNSVTLSGFGDQFGTYTNQSGTYGLPSQGIVLSTGNVNDYSSGDNTQDGFTTAFGDEFEGGENPASAAQEGLLDPITGGGFDHFDVAQLTISFDVAEGIDSVTFFGTFGSEEFPEFVGSEFVDGFGLFVNGQNVAFVNDRPINIDHPDFLGAVPTDGDDGGIPDFPNDGPVFEVAAVNLVDDGGDGEVEPGPDPDPVTLEPGDPRLVLVTGTELDGVLAPDVNPVLRFDVPVSTGANVFDIIIADTSDHSLDSVIYLSSFLPTEVDLNDGGTEFTPLLPASQDEETGTFTFDLPETLDLEEVFFIDPPVAVGYTYEVTDAEFKTIVAPSLAVVPDSDGYTIEIDGQVFTLLPGGSLDVSGLGASEFVLTGIDEALLLDPANFLAFPLGVALQNLTQGTLPTLSQTPITVDVPSPVPLPAGLPLYIAGILGFLGLRRLTRA
ncbi:choice-of-anchor L domain-containing protein [Hwanghaeella sp.]|uniref:choice-of-anchor L domain-containing protein n=1 Tax=Hwanghaeella sp. TaxID=2605943 RepID=UPI003CCB7D00